MNGSAITSKDTSAMFTCMKNVSRLFESMNLLLLNLYHICTPSITLKSVLISKTSSTNYVLLMRQILKEQFKVSLQRACEYRRLSFAPASVSHVVAGANKRRLYLQATFRQTSVKSQFS